MNIDLKSFSDETYKSFAGQAEPVLKRSNRQQHCHLEVTLCSSRTNDSEEEIREIARFLAGINENIPLHLSRYYPHFLLNKPATPKETLLRASGIAREHLNHVYIGNLPEADTNTYCPNCGKVLIERKYYHTKIHLKEPSCPRCGEAINIIL